jgi:hypothetical protein
MRGQLRTRRFYARGICAKYFQKHSSEVEAAVEVKAAARVKAAVEV